MDIPVAKLQSLAEKTEAIPRSDVLDTDLILWELWYIDACSFNPKV